VQREVFDVLPDLPHKIILPGIAIISETKILLAGGMTETGATIDSSLIYDTELKTYTEKTIPGWSLSELNYIECSKICSLHIA